MPIWILKVYRPDPNSEVLQALNTWQRDDFVYGTTDCAQLAGHVAKELTGVDYLATFAYASEREANDIIEQHGDLRATVSSVLGEPVESVATGCPVLVEINGQQVLGIKLADSAACLTKKGLTQVDLRFVKCGWKI